MTKLVVLITARVSDVHDVGEAWKDAGAPGVTFIEGYGLRRLQQVRKSTEVLPGMISMLEIMRENEETSMVALTLVEDDSVVDKLQAATESVLGSLYAPGSGIFFVVPVDRVVGLRDYSNET